MSADVGVLEAGQAERAEPPAAVDRRAWLALGLAAVVGLACGLSPFVGGFYSFSTWGVIALGALAVAWAFTLAGLTRPSGPGVVALSALVVLAGLSVISMSWAESADNAVVGASRWILYASVFASLVFTVTGGRIARLGIAAATGGIAVVGVYLLATMIAGDGSSLFLGGRLTEPLEYVNVQGLFLVLGVWPLIGWAQYARPLAAGLAAAGATALTALAFLSQSRSVVLAFTAGGLAVLLLVPGRVGRAWLLMLVIGLVASISAPLVDVYDLGRERAAGFEHAVSSAAGWIALVAVVAGVLWGAIVAAERSLRTPGLRRASAICLGALLLGGAGVLGSRADTIRTYVRDQARAFTQLQPNIGRSRFLSGGGNRYDYWRVAVHEFEDHPLDGVGADNYTRDYYTQRRTSEYVRQPHSIEFQTLAELGVFGTLALGVFLVAVGFRAVRHGRARGLGPSDHALLVGAVGAFAAWVAHASVDWPHLVPGATGIALLAAAYLVTRPGPELSVPAPRRRGAAGLAVRALASAGIVVGAIVVGRSVLAVHYVNEGKRELRGDPVQAIKKANDSLALNGDSTQALYLKSAGYARLGDYQRSRAALLKATRLEPHNFAPWALLGDIAVRRGQLAVARRSYARASRLNPRDRFPRALRRHPGS